MAQILWPVESAVAGVSTRSRGGDLFEHGPIVEIVGIVFWVIIGLVIRGFTSSDRMDDDSDAHRDL